MGLREVLFARNSSGQIKTWIITVDEHQGYGRLTITYGLYNKKSTFKVDIIKTGKNLGKANATTPYEQAILEAKSRIATMKKLGYKDNVDLKLTSDEINSEILVDLALPKTNTDDNDNIIPMKCQKYYKTVKRKGVETEVVRLDEYPIVAQPKFNGVRAFINKDLTIFSKKGLEYTILDHLIPDLKLCNFEYEGIDIILDGELYIPGEILSNIVSGVRTRNVFTSAIKFYCFDLAIPNLNQEERDRIRQEVVPHLTTNDTIINVRSQLIRNETEADDYFKWCLDNKFEGTIYRDLYSVYGFGKRPQYITKRKQYLEEEFTIIDIVPMEKDPNLGMFVCMTKEGKSFTVVPEGSHEQKAEYLRNKSTYLGQKVTCQFYEWSVNNIPFHAKGIAVRDYE
jgi:DNA ligase 1